MRTRLLVAGVVALLPFALLPIGWWLVGDLTDPRVRHESDLMYLLSPPRWSPGADRLVLATAGLVSVVLAIVLVTVVHRSRPLSVGLLLVAATVVVGLGWGWLARSLTVGAHGANMSALVVPLGPIILLVQVALAVFAGRIVDPARPGRDVGADRVGGSAFEG